jgi:hypothetical protein
MIAPRYPENDASKGQSRLGQCEGSGLLVTPRIGLPTIRNVSVPDLHAYEA